MVRLVVAIILINLSLVCVGQDNGIEFKASFNRDSVTIDDSLEVKLCYKNTSDAILQLFPKAIIAIGHHYDYFYSYDNVDRMMYILNDVCDYDSIVLLKPNEEFIQTLNIKIDSKFFNHFDNAVYIYYWFSDKPWNDKIFISYWLFNKSWYDRHRKIGKKDLFLKSSVIKIKVYPRYPLPSLR